MDNKKNWPAWRYGPEGKSAVFERESDVPAGWMDHPSKVGEKEPATTATTATIATTATAPTAPTAPAAPAATPSSSDGAPSSSDGAPVELDTAGWPWTAELHASSKSKTTQGLWRMKVGVSRPDPKPGYPLDL